MKHIYTIYRYKFLLALWVLSFCGLTNVSAQATYQPYSYQFYQKLGTDLYSTNTREHTALLPYFVDSLLKHHYDSLMNGGSKSARFFNRHLLESTGSNSSFYADLLPDFYIGKDFSNGNKTTSLSSIGFQFGGSVSNKLNYYVSGYGGTAVLPNYLNTYVNQVGIVPGEAYDRTLRKNSAEWLYLTGVVSYTPVKYLSVELGRDKTFIGDGYRSLILSDYASPYAFFKLTGTLGNVKYMVMWTDMNDPATTSQYDINRKKFGVFHYLDWNISNRLSFGFFDNVIGFFTDDNGTKRPFDFNYINPIIFMKPINNSSDDPDKSLLGFTGKYKISNGITAYGQFALNEFHSKDFFSSNGAFDNKYGWQLGLRGPALFGITNLSYLIETNNAKPYTYSARSAIESYSANGEPLAHPWGANFREAVGLLNYSYNRFDFSGEVDLGRYGYDITGANYGKDIFELYTNPARQYGNYTTQGITTNMTYFEGKVAYILNPKYNLRLELGGILRQEKNSVFNDKTSMLTIGLRSSFRTLYTDIASYKLH